MSAIDRLAAAIDAAGLRSPEEGARAVEEADETTLAVLQLQVAFAELAQVAWKLGTEGERAQLFLGFGLAVASTGDINYLADHQACARDGVRICAIARAIRECTLRAPGLMERAAAKVGSDAQLAVEGKGVHLERSALNKANFVLDLVRRVRDLK